MSQSKLPKVQVLLSTFNGQRYVEELIRSIIGQVDVEVEVLIRDDGSSDDTLRIIDALSENFSQIKLIKGQNLGVVRSFFELLKIAGDSDYYAFADQDDIWKPQKLASAVLKLKKTNPGIAAMYYSRLEFVDVNLEHIGYSTKPVFSGFYNALVQNQATGCTVVLNERARLIISAKLPDWALMHDWWCYLVTSAFGTVVYDDNSYILYRKHGKNVTPATPFFAFELLARIKRYLGDGNIPEKVTDQVREFKKLYFCDLSPENKSLTDEFLLARNSDFIGRFKYICFEQRVKRNTRLDNLILKILILVGKF